MLMLVVILAGLMDEPVALLTVIQREHAAAEASLDPHSRAAHWYRLNEAVDDYVDALNRQPAQRATADWFHPGKETPMQRDVDPAGFQRDTNDRIAVASHFGVKVQWCEPDADWTAGTDGYLQYLALWPDGPDAEEAWWRAKLIGHTRTGCYDGEGMKEEFGWFVSAYTEFLRHFPTGTHRSEA